MSSMCTIKLENMGWEFMPIGPNSWSWLKFSTDGLVEARQYDETWQEDIKLCLK